jgi:hypothetical protein
MKHGDNTMTYTPPTPPEDQPQKSAFSWKPPEKYAPKRDYYADLVMSYSALTDIIDPKELECNFGDIRALDSCLLEQSMRLNEITQKMLSCVFMQDGSIIEKRLDSALKVQHAFRESYRNANTAMTHRYIASTKPL